MYDIATVFVMLKDALFGHVWPLFLIPAVVILFTWRLRTTTSAPEPPRLSTHVVPYLGNTWQYIADNENFLKRASAALRQNSIVKFYLGPAKVYLISGSQNVQALFRDRKGDDSLLSMNRFTGMIMEKIHMMTKDDEALLFSDESGRGSVPNGPVASNGRRPWAELHHIFADGLARPKAASVQIDVFHRLFSERLAAEQPLGEWRTVHVYDYMKKAMAESAAIAFVGRRVFDRNPNLIDRFWEFDRVVVKLLYGLLPRWLNPKPYDIRDGLHGMIAKFLREDFDAVDWDSFPDVDWHPDFGSRFSRSHTLWARDMGYSMSTRSGYFVGQMSGLNGNTVPVTTWALFEIFKDARLMQAVREEALAAFPIDPATGSRTLNVQTLVSQPLLQSIYIEVMRLHVSMNITREVVGEAAMIGGYRAEKKTLLQAPTFVAHLNEDVWGVEGHSADEFWAERHVKYTESVDEKTSKAIRKRDFCIRARPGDFFPYGGGVNLCPGRIFAKQEIILTIAIMVARFDVEVLDWTTLDGAKSMSDRPALDDIRYSGAAGMPPDRDLRVRWRRVW